MGKIDGHRLYNLYSCIENITVLIQKSTYKICITYELF